MDYLDYKAKRDKILDDIEKLHKDLNNLHDEWIKEQRKAHDDALMRAHNHGWGIGS